MRPVARIAQSVEQGIENPCVLGSIPSPGTKFKETRLWRFFCFQRYGLSIELRSMTRLDRLALRANGKAVVQTPAALVRVRAPNLKKPAYGGFFAFRDADFFSVSGKPVLIKRPDSQAFNEVYDCRYFDIVTKIGFFTNSP